MVVVLCLLGLAVWLLTPPTPRIEDLTFTPVGSDGDAKALVERMLRVNQPWLDPRPVTATYSLRRNWTSYSLAYGIQHEQALLGPYAVVPGCKAALRAGSIVITPFHAMVADSGGYAVHMIGASQWKGKKVLAVDVAFAAPVLCGIGMGGQATRSYSHYIYTGQNARVLIDPTSAVPLLVVTSSAQATNETVWEFTPRFYEITGGRAPRGFRWTGPPDTFREEQEFQIANGTWIFQRGRADIPSMPVPIGTRGYFGKLRERIKQWRRATEKLELVRLQFGALPANGSPAANR